MLAGEWMFVNLAAPPEVVGIAMLPARMGDSGSQRIAPSSFKKNRVQFGDSQTFWLRQ
jgi:hypothetical protein